MAFFLRDLLAGQSRELSDVCISASSHVESLRYTEVIQTPANLSRRFLLPTTQPGAVPPIDRLSPTSAAHQNATLDSLLSILYLDVRHHAPWRSFLCSQLRVLN